MLPPFSESGSKATGNARRVKNLYQRENSTDRTDWKIVQAHLPLVKSIVGRMRIYFPAEVEMQDIYSIGVAGLVSASHSYDESKNSSFGAFASIRIRGALLDEMRKMDWLPRAERGNVKKFIKSVDALEQTLGHTPSDDEIGSHLKLEKNQVAKLKDQRKPLTFVPLLAGSIDDKSQDCLLQETIGDLTQPDARDQIEKKELIEQLRFRLEKLPDMQRKVLAMYYLNEMLLSEIALALGVSESRICQIHSQAINLLRNSLELHLNSE